MRKVFSLFLIFILSIILIGCNNEEEKLYFEIYDLGNQKYSQFDENNALKLRSEYIYKIKILGWNNKYGVVNNLDYSLLNIEFNSSEFYLEQDNIEKNLFLFYGKIIGETSVSFKYKEFKKSIKLVFYENNLGIINEDIDIIQSVTLLQSLDITTSNFKCYETDITNYKVNVKQSPIDYKRYYEEVGFSKAKIFQTDISFSFPYLKFIYQYCSNCIYTYDIIQGKLSNYLTDDFKKDLNNLKENKVDEKYIFDKYGTDIVVATVEGTYLDICFEIKEYQYDEYYNIVKNALSEIIKNPEYYNDYTVHLKQANFDVMITSSMVGDNWIQQLNNLKYLQQEMEYIELVTDTVRLYQIISSDDEAYLCLMEYYHNNF